MFASYLCDIHVFWTVLPFVLVLIFLINIVKCVLNDLNTIFIPNSSKHNWKSVTWLDKSCYCSVCEILMINGLGLFCDCCGLCVDQKCIKRADKKLPCKTIRVESDNFTHHWVKGNLPSDVQCAVCDEECNNELGLNDYQCCWCQRCVHFRCKNDIDKVCDFGNWRRLIIPPWSVRVSSKCGSMRCHRHVRAITHPGWNDWTPLIIIGNRKSGGGDGEKVLSMFRRFLNPCQIMDLAVIKTPKEALKWVSVLNEVLLQHNTSENESTASLCRIIVAGGDGSIAWVLSTINEMKLKPHPAVAVIPLGTGNDLSRVLGWGKGAETGNIDVPKVLEDVLYSRIIELDRWKVHIEPYRSLVLSPHPKPLFMYNYLSIGVDAQVALDFHLTRQSCFYIFSSRLFNKLLYLLFGTHQALAADCDNIQDRLEIYLDNKKVEIPSVESVIILNIPCWGAGVRLWMVGADDSVPVQRLDDEKLEVCAVYSSLHIAQLQVGLSQPLRLGQAKTIEIRMKEPCPIQIDGEPWEQQPANITLTFHDKAVMLKRKVD